MEVATSDETKQQQQQQQQQQQVCAYITCFAIRTCTAAVACFPLYLFIMELFVPSLSAAAAAAARTILFSLPFCCVVIEGVPFSDNFLTSYHTLNLPLPPAPLLVDLAPTTTAI